MFATAGFSVVARSVFIRRKQYLFFEGRVELQRDASVCSLFQKHLRV